MALVCAWLGLIDVLHSVSFPPVCMRGFTPHVRSPPFYACVCPQAAVRELVDKLSVAGLKAVLDSMGVSGPLLGLVCVRLRFAVFSCRSFQRCELYVVLLHECVANVSAYVRVCSPVTALDPLGRLCGEG